MKNKIIIGMLILLLVSCSEENQGGIYTSQGFISNGEVDDFCTSLNAKDYYFDCEVRNYTKEGINLRNPIDLRCRLESPTIRMIGCIPEGLFHSINCNGQGIQDTLQKCRDILPEKYKNISIVIK